MLTRLEVDGFKNLLGFSAEFGPFNCIAGPNGVGKSNLFDAIEFLSLLAEFPVKDAAKRIRGGGELLDLFYADGNQRLDRMRFAVEMITESTVVDDLGQASPPDDNAYRYELELGLRPIVGLESASRLVVVEERLIRNFGDLDTTLRFPGADVVLDKFITRGFWGGNGVFHAKPASANRTLLSRQLGPEDTRSMRVQREMRSWRKLALEGAALRRPGSIDDFDDDLTAAGDRLPTVLYRLAHQAYDGNPPDPEGFYASLAVRLSDLVSVRGVRVERDDDNKLHLQAELSGGVFPARSLSDGMLKFLALATLSFARSQRLLCIEEPENGVHPSRIPELVELLRGLATDPAVDLDYETTLRQVIINTHSPNLVREVHASSPHALLVATQSVIPGPFGDGARTLRLSPLSGTWRCTPDEPGVGPLPLAHFLAEASLRD